jgi:glycosyltransferase involved in cell wall biosynthesis
MRVLFITSAYPANADDPRGTFIHVLARSLVEEGLDITVLAPGAPGAPTRELRDVVQIRRATYWIPRWQSLATGLGGIVPNLRSRPWLVFQVPLLIMALGWRAVRLARESDLIHAHWVYPSGVAGVFAARMRRKPVVMTSHGGDLNLAMRSQFIRIVARWAAVRATKCVGVSYAMVDRFASLGVNSDRLQFLPLGVDVGRPNAAVALQRSPQLASFARFDGLRVVYAGSLIPFKSVETLIRAQRQVNQSGGHVASLIIGDGPAASALHHEASIVGTGLVAFAGGQPPQLVPSYMSVAQVLVLPSLAEGRGLVIIEAMAMGLPVVASDIDGPRELVTSGLTGLLFRAGSASDLAKCLMALESNPDLMLAMGSNGRAAVRQSGLSARCSAERHRALYDEVLRSWPMQGANK